MNRLEQIEQIDIRLEMIRNEQRELVEALSELLTDEEKDYRLQSAINRICPVTGHE